MAIIDLRNLVDAEYDTIEFTGSIDKKVYSCPVKRTMGTSLMLSQYFSDYMKNKPIDEIDVVTNIELNYRMIAAWVRGYYPELSVEWVKANVCDTLLIKLVEKLEPLFFPKAAETGTPKKNRKQRRS